MRSSMHQTQWKVPSQVWLQSHLYAATSVGLHDDNIDIAGHTQTDSIVNTLCMLACWIAGRVHSQTTSAGWLAPVWANHCVTVSHFIHQLLHYGCSNMDRMHFPSSQLKAVFKARFVPAAPLLGHTPSELEKPMHLIHAWYGGALMRSRGQVVADAIHS